MYEQRLPIEEWKFQKQKERNDTIAAQKKYCRKLCRMASALPTICTAGAAWQPYHIRQCSTCAANPAASAGRIDLQRLG